MKTEILCLKKKRKEKERESLEKKAYVKEIGKKKKINYLLLTLNMATHASD